MRTQTAVLYFDSQVTQMRFVDHNVNTLPRICYVYLPTYLSGTGVFNLTNLKYIPLDRCYRIYPRQNVTWWIGKQTTRKSRRQKGARTQNIAHTIEPTFGNQRQSSLSLERFYSGMNYSH